jgi:hypothetical protein
MPPGASMLAPRRGQSQDTGEFAAKPALRVEHLAGIGTLVAERQLQLDIAHGLLVREVQAAACFLLPSPPPITLQVQKEMLLCRCS